MSSPPSGSRANGAAPWPNECLEAILAPWTGAGPVTYQGRLIHFEDVSNIATHQRPHPPIWVGGASSAAFRRAARFGDAWHPILRSLDWVKETGLPGLHQAAQQAHRRVPTFCPRIRLDVRDESHAGGRLAGSGSVEQVHADLQELERLGAEHVILDWNAGDLAATQDHERGWAMLRLLAEQVVDLPRAVVR